MIGSDDPAVDAELIYLLSELYRGLGLKGVRLRLSSIGNPETRAEYEEELRAYLLGTDVFDEDQRTRIEVNPLRAFDWDGDEVRAVTDKAPKMLDRLDRRRPGALRRAARAARRGGDRIRDRPSARPRAGLLHAHRVRVLLRALGAQSGVGGGGRYDRLVEQIGGAPTPGAGWATGLERIAQALAPNEARSDGGRVRRRRADASSCSSSPSRRSASCAFALMAALRRGGHRARP